MEIIQEQLEAVEGYRKELLQKTVNEWTEDDQGAYDMLLKKEEEIIQQINDSLTPIDVETLQFLHSGKH